MKQQEKTILERRKHIKEILDRDDANVVYFLERYLTKTIESEREKVIGEIRGMKVRHATNTKGKVTKDDKPWQIELQKNIDVFNRTIDKIISKLK